MDLTAPIIKQSATFQRSVKLNKTSRLRLFVMVAYVSSTILFNYIYSTYSSVAWGYMGLTADFNVARTMLALPALACMVAVLPLTSGPRSFFLHFFVLLYLMPSSVLFIYNAFKTAAYLAIIMGSAVLIASSAIPIRSRVPRFLSLKVFSIFTVLVTAILMLALYYLGNASVFNLDLAQVYSFRDEAAESLPPIFGYIIPAFTKAVIPFGIAASLYYRYRNFAILLLAASVILFGMTSHKIMLFAPILVIVTYFGVSRYNPVVVLLGGSAAILTAIASAVYFLGEMSPISTWGWIESMMIWRSMILPTYLDYEHVEFFWSGPKYLWSTSQVTLGLLSPPYNGVQIPQVIGLSIFHDPTMVANAGFIGNGFAQAGLIGIVLYGLGVGLVLALMEDSASDLGAPFVISASLTLVLTMLVSTDFVSMFLTHGLILGICFLVSLVPAEQAGAARRGDQMRHD